jgi:ribosomal-protein-alanine N-acetyltransferase
MTERLEVLAPSLIHFTAFGQDGREGLGAMLGAHVPEEWPVFPESAAMPDQDLHPLWRPYWGVHRADRVLILEGGLAPPDSNGQVEFGYGLIPPYRGQGLATEFAAFLVAKASAAPEIKAVTAHTFPAGTVSTEEGFPADPSIAVLTRLGFSCIHQRELWLWRLPMR